ncbi:MAG TPA: response regulator transcription factor [Vicinamibacteria bacterium]|nr:response regulator transcription factor [Vicinamibacteria bacterium]
MTILLVEDDDVIAEFVIGGLGEAGYAVERARDGEEGLRLALDHDWDAAVVDVMLPRRDGLSLVEELRKRGRRTPVLILSARRSVDDRVRGLQAGGDDYLVKPFDFSELLARLQALLRRAGGLAAPSRLEVGELSLDLLSREVVRAGRRLDLRPRERALLEFLMRNPGRVVSRAALLSHVWGYSFSPHTNAVDVLVSRLRDKIDRGFPTPMLHTVRGAGYVLKAG